MPAGVARDRADAFLSALGLDAATPNLLETLRSVSVPDILRAQTAAAMKLGRMEAGDLRPPFTPTELAPHDIDSEAFIDAAASSAAQSGIDVMIGWTREEANLFLAGHPVLAQITAETLPILANQIYGESAAALLADVRHRRPAGSAAQLFLDLVTDACFRRPSLTLARKISEGGGQVCVYQFDWQSPDAQLGACHCLELPFMFGTVPAWEDAPLLAGADAAMMNQLSRDMVRRWAAFARTGQPGFPHWRPATQPIQHFDTENWLEGIQ
jgi:para-nitrobenzyl esterase